MQVICAREQEIAERLGEQMGTGYTTLDPSRRRFPPLIDSNDDEASTEVETDVGDDSLVQLHLTQQGAESGMVVE